MSAEKTIHCPDDGNLMTLTGKGAYLCTVCWKSIPESEVSTNGAMPDRVRLRMRKGNEGHLNLRLKGKRSKETADEVEVVFKKLGYKTMDRQEMQTQP